MLVVWSISAGQPPVFGLPKTHYKQYYSLVSTVKYVDLLLKEA